MLLTVAERLSLLSLLPAEGDVTTLRIVRDLTSSLSFSEEEHKELNFKSEGGSISWSPSFPEKDIQIGTKAKKLITSALESRNEKGTLHISILGLYERFVEPEPIPN